MSEQLPTNNLLQILTNHDEYDYIPLESLQQPFDGSVCLKNRFWYIIHDHAMIYRGKSKKSYSPQCNSHKNIADHRLKQIEEIFKEWNCRIDLIEYAFVENKER